MADQKESVNLLHPEILSPSDLRDILVSRGVNVPEEASSTHHTLVELFYRYVLPLPQRLYRNNRQGRALAFSQLRVNKKKRDASDPINANPLLEAAKKRKVDENLIRKSGLVNSPLTGVVGDKPQQPVSAVNFQRKTISLNSSKSPTKNTITTAVKRSSTENSKTGSTTTTTEVLSKKPRTKITWP